MAVTKYLDKTGLSHFWSKIKAWIESAASNLMHRTGDETIEGIKAFQNSYHDSTQPGQANYTSSSLLIRIPDYNKGTDAETNHHGNIVILDKDGTNQNWNGRLGIFEHVVYGGTTRANQTRITNYRNVIVNGEEVREHITLGLGYDDDGNSYASAPSTSALRNNGTDIVTRNWIPNDNRIVHTTGNETIDGVKTFSSVIQGDVSGTAGSVAWANVTGKPSSFPPSSHTHGNIANDGTLATANAVVVTDGSNKILASTSVTTTELSYLAGVTSSIQIQLNSKAADSGVVHTTGNETISGTKTFSSQVNTQQGIAIEQTSTIDGVSTTHKVGLDVNDTSLNAGLWDYTNSKWSWLIDKDGNSTFYGNASTATKLATARNLKVALGSTTDVTFDGSANQNSIPVSGVLAVANGGTGSSTQNFVGVRLKHA